MTHLSCKDEIVYTVVHVRPVDNEPSPLLGTLVRSWSSVRTRLCSAEGTNSLQCMIRPSS